MAFVYRSPRHLFVPEIRQQNQIESPVPARQKPQKSPIKGSAYKLSNHNAQSKGKEEEAQLYGLINNQKIETLKCLQEKPSKEKKGQYVFKSQAKRFKELEKENMVPSTLKIDETHKHQKRKQSGHKNLNLLHAKENQLDIPYLPSIPSKIEKFGYVIDDNSISYPKAIQARSKFEGSKQNSPGPGEYNLDCRQRKVKNIPQFEKMSPKSLLKTQYIFDSDNGLVNDREALKMHNEKIKEWISKSKQQKKNLFEGIKRQPLVIYKKRSASTDQTEDNSSSEEYQYEFDTTPGPGYYSYKAFTKKDHRSNKKQIQKIFYSQSNRFQKQQEAENNERCGFECPKQIKSKKKKFFMSKLPREFILSKTSEAPPPGYYHPRKSIENEAMNNIINKSKKVFDNNIPRLPKTIDTLTPGPGSYDLSQPNFKVESQHKESSIAATSKSPSKEQKLKVEEEELLEKKYDKKHIRIHEKINEDIEQKNYAPFMSSSPKGLKLIDEIITKAKPVRFHRLRQQSPKHNAYPFNSSLDKQKNSSLGSKQQFLASVGLYQLSDAYNWNKKSYNMYFH